MSLFNEILAGRYNGILHKLFSMKEGAPSPQLATEIFPVIPLDATLNGLEQGFLGGIRYCVSYGQVGAGGAGTRSAVQIFNPANSGILTFVEQVVGKSVNAVGVTLAIKRHDTALANGATGTRARDFRWGSQTPATQIRFDNAAAAVGTTIALMEHQIDSGVSTWAKYDHGFVLIPGTGILVDPLTDNQQCAAGFSWYERPVDPNELR